MGGIGNRVMGLAVVAGLAAGLAAGFAGVVLVAGSGVAEAAGCVKVQGVGSDRSRVGAIGKAQLIVNRHIARLGKGGQVSRRVNCVEGHIRNIPLYSCVITVRFCSLQGAKVRPRFPVLRQR